MCNFLAHALPLGKPCTWPHSSVTWGAFKKQILGPHPDLQKSSLYELLVTPMVKDQHTFILVKAC